MFGDPNLRLGEVGDEFPEGLQAKVLQVCAKGDPVSFFFTYVMLVARCLEREWTDIFNQVCDSGSCQYYHLTYVLPQYMEGAVMFIVRAFKGERL